MKNTTTEHVIGRKFVPKGSLKQNWNLVLEACESCNNRKSRLEDDISAVTLMSSLLNSKDFPPAFVEHARRKVRGSVSAATKKRVSESASKLNFSLPMGEEATINFKFSGEPELDEQRAFDLAMMQVRAFFYYLTYDCQTDTGRFWRGNFYGLNETARGDWGNPVMKAFAKRVVDWEPRFLGSTAQDFFKVAIRKHPSESCWSWALEWNQSRRSIGFFGDDQVIAQMLKELPHLEAQTVWAEGDDFIAVRGETRLPNEEDMLFAWEEFRYG